MKLKDLLRKADERELSERRTKAESKQGTLNESMLENASNAKSRFFVMFRPH